MNKASDILLFYFNLQEINTSKIVKILCQFVVLICETLQIEQTKSNVAKLL